MPLFAQAQMSPANDRLTALAAQVSRYEQQVASLNGTYDRSSIEIFSALAEAYLDMGRFDDAQFAYGEALQAIRISEGLASEAQLALINEMNVLLFEQQQWEDLDTNFHLAADIALRIYGFNDTRYTTAAKALAGWKIRAYQTGVYQGKGDRSIQQAAEIYRKFTDRLSSSEPDYEQLLANYLSARGLAYYLSAQHVANTPIEQFEGRPHNNFYQSCTPLELSIDGGLPASSSSCQASQMGDPNYFASRQRDKNNTVRRHLGNMRQSFQEAIDAIDMNPNATLRERAIAILNYGDANLLAEDYTRARTQYRRAYELLSEDNESIQLRTELLDQPQKALQGIIAELPFDEKLKGNVALGTISFDVSAEGEIQNINIEGAESALDQENIAAIAMSLGQSAYRPRIVEGRPVTSRVTISTADL